ncbi:hypothetical protein PSY31_22860, partial [Shigella flexneri]|nr:hypothetical protein [Shigella flexneri]
NGLGVECLERLNAMTESGLKPDHVTYLNVLMGCNHSGLVDEGRSVFKRMQTHHGLKPERQHYSCMIDLLGRAGLVDEAVELLKGTPWESDS